MESVRVAVICSVVDSDVARAVVNGLQAAGFDVAWRQPTDSDSTRVVVFSEATASAESFLINAVEGFTGRLVPVAIGRVRAGMPESLKSLNWVPWDNANRDTCITQIAQACTTDLDAYRTAQLVKARAHGWVHSGRRKEDSIRSRKDLTSVLTALDRGTIGDADPVIREYLDHSRSTIRKNRNKWWRRLCLWAVFGVGMATAVAGFVNLVVNVRPQGKLETIAWISNSATSVPYAQAVKLAALLDYDQRSGLSPSPDAMSALVDELSAPWPGAVTAYSPTGKAINDVAVLGRNGAILADGGGTLWRYTYTPEPTKIATVSTKPLTTVSVSPDGTTIITSDGDKIYYRHGHTTRTTDAPAGLTAISMTPDGSEAVAAVGNEARLLDLRSMTWTGRTHVPRLLAVSAQSGTPLAASADAAGDLMVTDVATGRHTLRTHYPLGKFGVAAFSASGDVVVAGKDRRLWTDTAGDGLTSTGLIVPDVLSTLALSSNGEILYGAPQFGEVRVYDAKHSLQLAPICSAQVTTKLSIATDGSVVYCSSVARGSAWAMSGIRPESYSGAPTRSEAVSSVAGPIGTVTTTGPGAVRIRHGAHDVRLNFHTGTGLLPTAGTAPPIGTHFAGHITTMATSPAYSAVTVGSSDGRVVEVELLPSRRAQVVVTWSTPDGSPITGIRYDGAAIRITTPNATWAVPNCSNCASHPGHFIEQVRRRMLPCYSGFQGLIPGSERRALGIRICPGG